MNGHWRYADLDVVERKRLLACFSGFVRRLPVTYVTFNYRMSEVENTGQLARCMFQDVCGILNGHLAYFQGFDQLKVYYDDGQPSVSRALHATVEDSISRQAIVYRGTRFESFRLAQTADYLCAIELAALKYERGVQTATDQMFYGGAQSFKRNWLKHPPVPCARRAFGEHSERYLWLS